MIQSWSVVLTLEHEFCQDDTGGIGLNTIKVERQIAGDDEACDALYAAQTTKEKVRNLYSIPAGNSLRVIRIDICEVDERG